MSRTDGRHTLQEEHVEALKALGWHMAGVSKKHVVMRHGRYPNAALIFVGKRHMLAGRSVKQNIPLSSAMRQRIYDEAARQRLARRVTPL